MVKLDLNVAEVVGLAENASITAKQLKKYLSKFDKEELAAYILKEAAPSEDSDVTVEEPEDPDEDPEEDPDEDT